MRLSSSTAQIFALRTPHTSHGHISAIINLFLWSWGLSVPQFWHCSYWLFCVREKHAHPNRLLDLKTMRLPGYFASTGSQTLYKLYSHCFPVYVRLEVCMETCEVNFGTNHESISVILLNPALLIVKTCLGIRRNRKLLFPLDQTMQLAFLMLVYVLSSSARQSSGVIVEKNF